MQDEPSGRRGLQRRRDVLRTLGAGALAVGVAGCNGGGEDGDGADTPESTDTETDTSTPTTTPDPNCDTPVEVSERIESDTTWNCSQYLLTRDVRVTGSATLRIEAGVELLAQQSIRFIVDDDATLVVAGTANQPVRFRGEQDASGFWDGIEFNTSSTSSTLDYAEIANGGNGDWANVYVQNGSAVSLRNSTFTDCSTYGVIAEQETDFPEFASNTFSDNADGAVSVAGNSIGALDSDSTYAGGSGEQRIAVTRETVADDATWPATDVPLHFTGDGRITAAITVDPGAQFTFDQSTRLIVDSGGSLEAVGEQDSRIEFRGGTEVSGFWDGIEFASTNPNNVLDHCLVAHGGNGDWSNVYVQSGASVSLRNSAFEDCSTFGVATERGSTLTEFASNTFSGNAAGAASIPGNSVGALDSDSTYGGGSGEQRIAVTRGTVSDDATWPATDVPINFTSDGRIQAAVTVDPGAQFTFDQSTRLIVDDSGGSLEAVGTSDEQITFEGATAQAGFWDGIEFASLSPDNVLDNCLVAHGGNGGWANVYVQSTGMVTVRNCTIRDSATAGIYAERDARLTESGNQFMNVVDGGVVEG